MNKTKSNFFIKNGNLETRSLDDGSRQIIGLIPYNSKSEDLGFYEILNPGCFKKTIQEKRIVALYNHDSSMVLGNNKNGTLILEDTDAGLLCTCTLPNTTFAADAYETIKSGNVQTMSFGFRAIRESYDPNKNLRTILEAALEEISFAVCFPAYEGTDSEARSLIFQKRNINISELESVLSVETFTDENINQIRTAIDALTALIPTHDKPQAVAPVADPDKVAKLKQLDLMLFDIDHQV